MPQCLSLTTESNDFPLNIVTTEIFNGVGASPPRVVSPLVSEHSSKVTYSILSSERVY